MYLKRIIFIFAPHFRNNVKELAKYDIDIYGLQHKQYVYDFESGSAFFEEIDQELVSGGDFKTHLILNKSETMMILDFEIKGTIELTCDRSLDLFDEPIDLKERLILKFGNREEVYTDEMEVIKADATRINVSNHIFEYVALAMPMKRLHPRFRDGDNDDEEVLVYSSENKEESIDPRWAKLNQLK